MKQIFLLFLILTLSAYSDEYNHNKFGIKPVDILKKFKAFELSFDSKDNDNKDVYEEDVWVIAEWVAFEIRETGIDKSKSAGWKTDNNLRRQGIAPGDESYHIPKAINGSYRVTRGHLCSRETAGRISQEASVETHTLLNAMPQLQGPNAGIWADLEAKTREWAEEDSPVWVIAGPIFTHKKTPSLWLGAQGELQVAIPDFLFKIVIKKGSDGKYKTLSFLMPNFLNKKNATLDKYLVSVKEIEEKSGLTFFTKEGTNIDKSFIATNLW